MSKEMKEAIKDLCKMMIPVLLIVVPIFTFLLYKQCNMPESDKRPILVSTLENGCNLYKINDNYNIVYFADCSGKTSYRYSSGKSTKQREVETIE